MQITTVLVNAAPRVVNKKDGSGSFTLYELFDHEGTAWVVKQELFSAAMGLIGQTVDMIVRVEQNGQWTNRYADQLRLSPVGSQVPASNATAMALQIAQQAQAQAQPQAQATQAQPQPTWADPVAPQVPNTIGGMGRPQIPDVSVFPTKKDESIHRQTAAKVAATFSSTTSEFWSNCLDLARYFDTGQLPTAASGQMVGAGYQQGSEDDIPF